MDTSYNHSVYNRKRRRKLWIRRIAALLAVIGLVCGLFFGVRAAYWGIRGLVDKSLGRETSAADSNEETEPVQRVASNVNITALQKEYIRVYFF